MDAHIPPRAHTDTHAVVVRGPESRKASSGEGWPSRTAEKGRRADTALQGEKAEFLRVLPISLVR